MPDNPEDAPANLAKLPNLCAGMSAGVIGYALGKTAAMRLYVTMFLVAGVVVPIALHVVAADRMPWWPDTVSIGITFGVCAVVMAWKARADREMNHRLWTVLKAWGIAIGSHFGSN